MLHNNNGKKLHQTVVNLNVNQINNYSNEVGKNSLIALK